MRPSDIDRFNDHFHRRPQRAMAEKIMSSTALATAADSLDAKWARTKKAWVFALRSGGFQQAARDELRLKHYDPETGQPLYSPSGVLFEVLGLEPAVINGTAYYVPNSQTRALPTFAILPTSAVGEELDIGDAEAAALNKLCGFPGAVRHMLRLELQRGRSFADIANLIDWWF